MLNFWINHTADSKWMMRAVMSVVNMEWSKDELVKSIDVYKQKRSSAEYLSPRVLQVRHARGRIAWSGVTISGKKYITRQDVFTGTVAIITVVLQAFLWSKAKFGSLSAMTLRKVGRGYSSMRRRQYLYGVHVRHARHTCMTYMCNSVNTTANMYVLLHGIHVHCTCIIV